MTGKRRRKTVRIQKPEQLRILNSPVSFEVVQMLRTRGQATVAEIGRRLQRKPNSLHYHLRKLVQAGLVRQVGTRLSGARTERVYDVTADRFVGDNAPPTPLLRKLTVDAVATLLRLALRNFDRATERRESLIESGKYRNILANRHTARLTRAQIAQANHHLQALESLFTANIGSDRGRLHALTLVLTPVKHETTEPEGHDHDQN